VSTASEALGVAAGPRILLVAGEASGDAHAAELVHEIRRLSPGVRFHGIGGAGARAAGMETTIDASEIATMGLTEVAEKGRAIVRAYRRLRREIRESPPDLVVLIDFPEFNLALAGVARRRGVPVLYYVSPQVWAWRRGRVRKILRRVDRLAVIFPFEAEVYGHDPKVVFVGHPAVDRVRTTRPREETLRRHGFDPQRRLVTLLPGSRRREIDLLLPEMIGAAARLGPGRALDFAIGLAPTIARELVEGALRTAPVPVRIVEGDTYDLIGASSLVLAASGTVTLETALLERPMVIAYRVSRTTAFFGRLLIRVPFIGMANLIAGRAIVPELVQEEATAERIAAEAAAILDDPERERRMIEELGRVRAALGESGAAARAAALALALANEARS
jgi:lipid-A-disaccharide synthase